MRRVAAAVLLLLACRPDAAPREPSPHEPEGAPITTAPGAPSAADPQTRTNEPVADARTDVDPGATRRVPETPRVRPPSGDTPAKPEPAENAGVYDRAAWPHWIDADGDCQDTRTEVLIAESEIPVRFTDARRCEVASGRWRCPYTDRTITDPRKLDVDHLVPLANAHASGAAAWDLERRRAYANDLDDPDHLIAVVAAANRSKGARTIETWLPDEPGFRCEYVAAWHRVKQRWNLTESAAEHAAVEAARTRCAGNDVPEVAGKAHVAPATTDTSTDRDPGACCRVCKAGKACGDGCIAADKTCHKPPGCACPRP